MQTEEIGMVSLLLGVGRETKESVIDLSAGIQICVKIGDYVKAGDTIALLHANDNTKMAEAEIRLLDAVIIEENAKKSPKHVLAIL